MPDPDYFPRRSSSSAFVDIGRLKYHVRLWGKPSQPPLVMLHGHRDAAISYQFVVDAFASEHFIIAPDWRGHGFSGWAERYNFHDYLADLDALLDHFLGDISVPVIGHSLGGNVACIFAGLRPRRVSHLVSLDGFGLPARDASLAPAHMRIWLDSLRQEPTAPVYDSVEQMALRLQRANPLLDARRAYFLAAHVGRRVEGGLSWAFDPAHRRPFAVPHRFEEWRACVEQITAPVMWIGSGDAFPQALGEGPYALAERIKIARAEFHNLPGTPHNMHHVADAAIARLIEEFLGRTAAEPDA
jgi:pimeloyl-ACP methyl ester carboxylesterase